MKTKFIPKNKYRKIVSLVPICCVDLIIKENNSFLLVKRREAPAKDRWWFPGGRVLFGESLLQTAKRKLREELNIKSFQKIKFLRVKEIRFLKSRFNQSEHNIVNLFLVKVSKKDCAKIRADQTMFGYKWYRNIEKSFHPYIKANLKLTGFK